METFGKILGKIGEKIRKNWKIGKKSDDDTFGTVVLSYLSNENMPWERKIFNF